MNKLTKKKKKKDPCFDFLERRIKIEACKVEIFPPLLVGLSCNMASQTKGTTFATKALFHLPWFCNL